MPTVARLARTDLTVVPGGSDAVEITVTNTGQIVDQFTLEPLGDGAGWFRAEPPTMSLFPGASGTATITVAPPRTHLIPATAIPFAIRVLSHEDPGGSAVEEGRINVGRFDDVSAELLPHTAKARGRRYGKYQIAVDNRGNSRLNVDVVPVDAEQVLDFAVDPSLVVEPGEAAFLPLKVRARRGFNRGTPVTHQFQIVANGSAEPLPVAGTLLQEARIPRWMPRALLGLLLLAGLLVGAWFALLKPVVKDTATDAANNASQAAVKQAAAANNAAQDAKKAAQQAAAASGGKPAPSPVASPKPSASPSPSTLDPLGDPSFYRLTAAAGQQTPSVTFPAKSAFSLTDIVLENPAGDDGTLTILRDKDTLLSTNLANFRDLDYHFQAPWEFGPGQVMTMKVTCKTPGAGSACTPAVSINGFTRVLASPAPTPGT